MEDYPVASSKLTDNKTMFLGKFLYKKYLIKLNEKDFILVIYHK